MNRFIDTTRLILFATFLLVSAGAYAYQAYYIWPMQKCERAGDWWSPKDRACATPIPLWRFTGRLPATPETPAKATAPAP
jgi:hypothetical protein